MRRLLTALGAALLTAASPLAATAAPAPTAAAPALAADAPADTPRSKPAPLRRVPGPIPGQYIVTLKKGATPDATLRRAAPEVRPIHRYQKALNGFAARLSPEQLTAVRASPDVLAVEEDGYAHGHAVTAPGARRPSSSWGLDRIDQPYLPLDQQFEIAGTGAGARVYVIDSGIDFAHAEFAGGRAVAGYDGVRDGYDGADCHGHGTHVAGIVGGATHGVARQATLVSVRVLDCANRSPVSRMIDGFDWVARNARQPAVLNASLGTDFVSEALNSAADNVASRGILPVTSAGNTNEDACGISPASAPWALTVGATDYNDMETHISNFGPCVELYAPGEDIVSARAGGGRTAMSGTSMAGPHVAGVAAVYKSAYPSAGPERIGNWLIDQATPNVLDVHPSSPNRLLNTGGL